jgi:itaconate CoA-transferase
MPGGQPAYLRAARRSEGGTSIVALTSTVSDGTSKIVASLPDSAVVTTPRVDVDHVVTELGSASLVGETLVDRTAHLISVAPERERAFLEEAAQQHGLL